MRVFTVWIAKATSKVSMQNRIVLEGPKDKRNGGRVNYCGSREGTLIQGYYLGYYLSLVLCGQAWAWLAQMGVIDVS
jgi:hypothetical protein